MVSPLFFHYRLQVDAKFRYYVSIAKDIPFGKRFFEMVAISFSVAALTFIIGYFVKLFLGVDI